MTSRLMDMQARFQQKQMQEREERLLKLYENQQQRTIERVSRGSAGSNTSVGSTGGGKVRQMFDERRKAGVDRSYPLEPLKSKTNARGAIPDKKTTTTSKTIVKSTVQKSVSTVKNGKPLVSKREIIHSVYNNNNGNESFEENKYEDDMTDVFNSNSHREIIEMMNNHNLNDSLDNEQMPQIGFDEVDEVNNAEKSAEVTGKFSSRNSLAKKVVEPKPAVKANSTVTRKESTPAVKKPTRASLPARTVSSPTKSPRTSTPTSPSKTSSANMQKPKSTSARAPSNSRPSAKQTVRSGVVRDDLEECSYCGRRFAADRVAKHEEICSKTGKKKRKPFDATKHRVLGTELESYVLTKVKGKTAPKQSKLYDGPTKQDSKSTKPAAKKDWRTTHEEFIAAIRAAKEAQAHIAKGGKLSDLPPPPPSSNPDYVQCPHCGRRFSPLAAERHVPKCASYQFNKPKPGAAPKKTVRR